MSRIAFFGTPDFAVPTLHALLDAGVSVVAVVTQPDKPRGRGQRVSVGPVKAVAESRGLAVLQPPRLSRELVQQQFQALDVDLGVVAAYGKILPEWVLRVPRVGMVNVHASLLPKYRGAAPVHRAILAGEAETGVTIMRVIEALDAGAMIAKRARPIGPDESSDVVERDLATMGADLLLEVLPEILTGRAIETPQVEADATYAPRLTKSEGRIDFAASAASVHNKVRALRAWPTAQTQFGTLRLMVHRTALSEVAASSIPAGTLMNAARGEIVVACGDGRTIALLEVQPEGRRVMSTRDFLAGHRLEPGIRFT